LYKYHVMRHQRQKLVDEYVKEHNLSFEEEGKYRRKMLRKESYFLRLRRSKSHINDFTVLTMIGQGGYGQVFLAKWKEKNQVVVLKRMRKTATIDKNEILNAKRERDVLESLSQSQWIAQLLMSWQDDTNLWFAMEYCAGGDLQTFLQNCGPCEPDEAKFYFSEMVAAVSDLHAAGYIHRDLKPGNFVIQHTGHLKLIDFGLSADGVNNQLNQNWNDAVQTMSGRKTLSRTINEKKSAKEKRERRYSKVGSPCYMAVEVLTGDGYDSGVDFWSLGVLLYELLVGCSPFEADTVADVFANIYHWQDNLIRPTMEDGGVEICDASWSLITSLIN